MQLRGGGKHLMHNLKHYRAIRRLNHKVRTL